VFQVNYLLAVRKGSSDVRVTSGSVVDSVGGNTNSQGGNTQAVPTTPTTGSSATRSLVSSRVTTTSNTDFWSELDLVVKAIVGDGDGRNVVVSPQSGMIVVRAMPTELRNVETYLKRAQLIMDRQVILEAKIMKVDLTDSNQAGINWAALDKYYRNRLSLGASTGNLAFPTGTYGTLTAGTLTLPNLKEMLGSGMTTSGGTTGGMFGLAFQTGSFNAVMEFLETQGSTHVLSSPRIATVNNQQAVLKVGVDQFFVTNVSSSTTTTAAGTSSLPNVTLQPFFSGIVLDVTPQIDEDGNIILHVHPAVSKVTEVQKVINLGDAIGTMTLPLAQSDVSETDSIIRTQNGQIVAIGGLMKQQAADAVNQVPGLGNVPGLGMFFRNSANSVQKQELVILLKATVVESANDWNQDILQTQERIRGMTAPGKAMKME
jgi:MSHA biogenesis protein MshL